jgi:hypothetical protein
MAKVKGLIQLVGTLNSINFYLRKGVLVARSAGGGFSGEAIKSKPSMEKVRQNGNEFGQVSRMVKVFKMGIAPLLFSHHFPELHGRLMRLFTAVKNEDLVSIRGSRTFMTGLNSAEGRKLMTGFCIPAYSPTFVSLYPKVHFDFTTGCLHFTADLAELFSFMNPVAAISFQVGVLELDAVGCVLKLAEPLFITAASDLPEQVLVPDFEVSTARCLAVVSLCHYERKGEGFVAIGLKSSFYFEVVGVG